VKQERLQKVLAHAGLGSRRACEELILQGRVSINGEVVRQLGTRVDATRARITVDGEPIKLESMVYYAVNKPTGYVSTDFDPSGRPRVVDLLPEIPERVYTVGRLDEDSTGLLILTNDGELANRLAHPRYGVEKLYRALVAGLPSRETMVKLTEGIWLSDGKVRAKRARIAGRQGQATTLELVLAEGKKREIRRMLSKLGHKVMSLNRIAVGPISLKGLASGECRPLTRHEVELLRKVAAGMAVPSRRFFGADSSTRPHHDESRPPRRAENHGRARNNKEKAPRRPHRSDEGPPRRSSSRRDQAENTQHKASKRHQPARPRNSHAEPQRASQTRGNQPSPKPRGKFTPKRSDETGSAVKSPRAGAPSSIPPEPLRPRRRVIGLVLESQSRTGPNAKGGRTRKRPEALKRRPPGRASGKKDNRSSHDSGRPDEDV
jgi:23S rRNA pseudouridine2605 synthase